MRWAKIWVAAMCLALAGCAGSREKYPDQIQGIADDQESPQITINGAMIRVGTGGPNYNYRWFIRSFVDKKTREVTHQLYFAVDHDPPRRHFLWAYDDTGKQLSLIRIGAEKDCAPKPCSETEDIAIPIDAATLLSRLTTGYNVKVSAREGYDYVLDFGAKMIQLQLAAVNQVLANLGPVAAQPVAPAAVAEPRLGVALADLPADHPAKQRNPGLVGIEVVSVKPGSPADKAGIVAGDVIVDYDGKTVASAADLAAAVTYGGVGRNIAIGVTRWAGLGRVGLEVQM